jgi:hypothetical protein
MHVQPEIILRQVEGLKGIFYHHLEDTLSSISTLNTLYEVKENKQKEQPSISNHSYYL